MRGMILAAGFGTRSRPLSDRRPKPCFPVLGRPLIHFAVDFLRGAGVTEIVVNLHHLGDQVRAALGDGSDLGVRVAYSPEETILGTGGAIRRAREMLVDPALPDEPILVANADTILLADLAGAIHRHRERGALATMVVTRSADPARYGAVRFDDAGRVLDIAGLVGAKREGEAAVFAGVHILSPAVFTHLPDRDVFCIVRDVLVPLVRAGAPVLAAPADGPWLDAGTPADYLAANRALLEHAVRAFGQAAGPGSLLAWHFPLREGVYAGALARFGLGTSCRPPVLVGKRARVESGAVLGPYVVVGEGARIGARARLANTVVWDGAAVREGEDLVGCIVTPEGVVPVDPRAA